MYRMNPDERQLCELGPVFKADQTGALFKKLKG